MSFAEKQRPEPTALQQDAGSKQQHSFEIPLERRLLAGVTEAQRPGMQWLIDHLTPEQLAHADPAALIEHVQYAYRAREELPFARQYTDEQFFNFVLNPVIINEVPGEWRAQLFNALVDVVRNARTPQEAAELVDQWVFNQLHPTIPLLSEQPMRDEVFEWGTRWNLLHPDAPVELPPVNITAEELETYKRPIHDKWMNAWGQEQKTVLTTAVPEMQPLARFFTDVPMVPFRDEMEYESLTTKLTTAALRSIGIGASPTFINSWGWPMGSGGGATWTTVICNDSVGRVDLVPIGAPNPESIAMHAGDRIDGTERGWFKGPLFSVAGVRGTLPDGTEIQGVGGAGTKVWMIDSANANAHTFNGLRVMDLTNEPYYMQGRTGSISVRIDGEIPGREGNALVELIVPDKNGWTAVDSTTSAFWGGQEIFHNVGANLQNYAVRVTITEKDGTTRMYARALDAPLEPGRTGFIYLSEADRITAQSPQNFGPRTTIVEWEGIDHPGEIIRP